MNETKELTPATNEVSEPTTTLNEVKGPRTIMDGGIDNSYE